MTDWPASLPQDALLNGFAHDDLDNTIRSSMSYGPDKVRRRTTASIAHVTVPLVMTKTQLAALKTFYETTLQVTGQFTWKNHITQASINYRFRTPPAYRPIRGDLWAVTLELETMP